MFSRKKRQKLKFTTLIIARLYPLVLLLLFSSIGFAEKNSIKIREFKYYREISFLGKTLFFNKKTLDLYYSDRKKNLKILRFKDTKTATFAIEANKATHYIIVETSINRKPKLGYLLRGNQVQYQDNICKRDGLYENKLRRILDPELISKVQRLEVASIFDKETCGAITQETIDEFKEALVDALVLKTSELKACAESEDAQQIFQKDMVLMQNSLEVFGRYFALVDGLRESGIKFKCGLAAEDHNKVASFSQNPLEIAVNIIDKKFNLNLQNISSTINHELIHYGMSQYKEKENSRCLDEGFVQLFEAACKFDKKLNMVPPKSSSIVEHCLQGKSVKISTHEKSFEDGGDFHIAMPALELENREQSKAITSALVERAAFGTTAAPYVPVSDSVVKLAATAPVVTTGGRPISAFEGDGEFHRVETDSGFADSVRQLSQSLSASMNNSTQLLNSAIGNTGMLAAAAAAGSKAIAATTSGASFSASTQYAPMTATEIFVNRYYPDSPSVQVVMNNPKLDTMTYSEKEAYFRSLAESPTGLGSKSLASADQTIKKSGFGDAAVRVSKSAAQVGGTSNTGGASAGIRNVASVGGATSVEATSVEEKPAITEEKSNVANLRSNIASQPKAQIVASTTRLDNAIIQRLSAFSKVNEPAYSKVTQRFNDEIFRQQLNGRKIRIVGENGKPLWASSTQPQRCFKDNKTTKVLEVVACK